jgi:hypothetical protein
MTLCIMQAKVGADEAGDPKSIRLLPCLWGVPPCLTPPGGSRERACDLLNARACVRVRACACVSVRACVRGYICAYVRVRPYAYYHVPITMRG